MGIGAVSEHGTIQIISIEKVKPSPFQVRKRYGRIDQLAADIEDKGLLYPILVRPTGDGCFEIVHGHRRFKAVKSLPNKKFIECFIRELSDSQAILVQGSENIQRKNYDAIEEGTLYKNYRDFVEKEKGIKLSLGEIAAVFNSSSSNVEVKIGLLALPQNVQEKIAQGKIPFSKARKLLLLTKDVSPTGDTAGFRQAGQPWKSRTDKYFFEIQKLATECEKDAESRLRTEEGVGYAVGFIKNGKPIDVAIDSAKMREAIDLAKQQADKGKPPREIIKKILESQKSPKKVMDATSKLELENLTKLLESGLVKCPYCGGDDLVWECKHKRLVNESEKGSSLNNFDE